MPWKVSIFSLFLIEIRVPPVQVPIEISESRTPNRKSDPCISSAKEDNRIVTPVKPIMSAIYMTGFTFSLKSTELAIINTNGIRQAIKAPKNEGMYWMAHVVRPLLQVINKKPTVK